MKKLSKSAKAIEFMQKNPNAKPSEIAKKFGFSANYVYVLRSNMKKKTRKSGVNIDLVHTGPVITVTSAAEAPKPDMVNNPPHYTEGGIETIDFIEAKRLDYHLGNVVKYVTRAGKKGSGMEDLLKAQWYLNRAIEKRSDV